MNWVFELHRTNPTAQAIAIISFVCVIGMSLGSIRVRGVKLGTSGVIFAALLVGHFSEPVDHKTLEFVKEFGLILFVFCIGLQLGPGFFSSFRQSGLRLNLLASAIVAFGAVTAVGLGWLLGFDGAVVLGLFSGATTNTPSLGATQQTLASFPGVTQERAALPALAYAVSYPIGILGIIATLLALKSIFRVDLPAELKAVADMEAAEVPELEQRALVVENHRLEGLALAHLPGLTESGVVISRICRLNTDHAGIALDDMLLQVGDTLYAVGTNQGLDHLERVVGRSTPENPFVLDDAATSQKIIVTNGRMVGKPIRELKVGILHDVVVTSVSRGDVEMMATPGLRIRFGDVLQMVGNETGLDHASRKLGNSVDALNATHFVPLFAGICVGILLGTFPIAFPGLPQPLKIGLAGGPLIVAIVVGRIGRIGRLVWHMPRNANLAFRELGIALFFAAVGLLAGPSFFAAAFTLDGLLWLLSGVCITVFPLMIVGIFARTVLAMNYVTLSGLLAGSMTDPPALAFASGVCQSESPAVTYAAVYPLTMLLRIFAAQALTLILCR